MSERDLARFMAKVEKTETCWLWRGPCNRQGYGRRSSKLAHRVSYEQHVGPIPPGLQLDHLCRVRNCVNPAHLEPVTARVNVLRGESELARIVRANTCRNGHEFTPSNTHVDKRGWRHCRACHRHRALDAYHRTGDAARRARRAQAKDAQ